MLNLNVLKGTDVSSYKYIVQEGSLNERHYVLQLKPTCGCLKTDMNQHHILIMIATYPSVHKFRIIISMLPHMYFLYLLKKEERNTKKGTP